MTATKPSRCLHSDQGECPKCRAFARSLVAAVEARETAWRVGILAALNKQSEAAR